MPEYIEREKTVEILRSLGSRDYRRENGTIQDAIETLSSPEYTPAADVAPVVHGRWIKTYEDCDLCHECSLCGKPALLDGNEKEVLSPWCPHCGVKMDLE